MYYNVELRLGCTTRNFIFHDPAEATDFMKTLIIHYEDKELIDIEVKMEIVNSILD